MRFLSALAIFALCSANTAHAEVMPDPVALSIRMGTGPVWLTVYEPHLTVGDTYTEVRYEGYPMEEVLALLFGPEWMDAAQEIEFRALDGYVSRIPVERFEPGRAVLAYARGDGAPFTVDNIAQNQMDVPLGPYYLVWNNINDEALRAEGAHNWPYQVNEVLLSFGSGEAMRFETPRPEFDEAIDLTKRHCISCHQVNGYGGNKHPANLAQIAKTKTLDAFAARILDPASVMPVTTMPPLDMRLPEDDRTRIAQAIHAYLVALPVVDTRDAAAMRDEIRQKVSAFRLNANASGPIGGYDLAELVIDNSHFVDQSILDELVLLLQAEDDSRRRFAAMILSELGPLALSAVPALAEALLLGEREYIRPGELRASNFSGDYICAAFQNIGVKPQGVHCLDEFFHIP